MSRAVASLAVVVSLLVLTPGASAAPAVSSPCPGDKGDPTQSGWALSTTTFDNSYTRHPYVGNGYLSQRVPATGTGYVATTQETGWPLFTNAYDGAFVAGLYARDPGLAGGRAAIAAIPTWSTLKVTAGGASYTGTTSGAQISDFRQTLFLRCGVVRTQLTWTPAAGRATELTYDVIAARANPHVGAVRLTVTPRWSGSATVTDVIDGAGARRLTQTGGGAVGSSATVDVAFRTLTTEHDGAVASTLTTPVTPTATTVTEQASGLTASRALTFDATSGRSYEFTKFVGVNTDLTAAEPESAAITASQAAASGGWRKLFADHASAWADLWKSDILVSGRPELQDWIRSNLYALQSSVRAGADDSIAPAGLSSDNYAGLIFWDAETWMFPTLLGFHPDLAQSIVDYRRKTIPGARTNAMNLGYQGLFFPWNSAEKGDLATECHSVDPPHCITQIHLQGDIALAVWQSYLAGGDVTYLRNHWSLLRGNAEYFASRVTANADGSYSLENVAGPDEYSNGVNDGVFTNAGAATALRNATRAAQILGEPAPAQWKKIADNLRMPFDEQNQVFVQYDGYQGTQIKQADTVLLIYPMEWPMSTQVAANTLDYYAPRTDPDGPAMTDAIHAIDAAQIGEPGCQTHTYLMRSVRPFMRDPFAQFTEARGDKAGAQDPLAGSPAYNFLTGSGGFSQVFTFGLTGLRWREDGVRLDPMLPPQLAGGVTLKGLHWHGRTFDVAIGPSTTTVSSRGGGSLPLDTPGGAKTLANNGSATLTTRRPDLAPTDDVARCKPATASTEEPGKYAEAAVDGSTATTWAPTASPGTLTVDLGSVVRLSSVVAQWETAPASSQVLASRDGTTFTTVRLGSDGRVTGRVDARYVRVQAMGSGTTLPALRELEVRG
jgi:trehalose/maltose hydrolase-like predicted phosphorylase